MISLVCGVDMGVAGEGGAGLAMGAYTGAPPRWDWSASPGRVPGVAPTPPADRRECGVVPSRFYQKGIKNLIWCRVITRIEWFPVS